MKASLLAALKRPFSSSSPIPQPAPEKEHRRIFQERVVRVAGQRLEPLEEEGNWMRFFDFDLKSPLHYMDIVEYPFRVMSSHTYPSQNAYGWNSGISRKPVYRVKWLRGLSWTVNAKGTSTQTRESFKQNFLERGGWVWPRSWQRNGDPYAEPRPDGSPAALEERFRRIAQTRKIVAEEPARTQWLAAIGEQLEALIESSYHENSPYAPRICIHQTTGGRWAYTPLKELLKGFANKHWENPMIFYAWCELMDQWHKEGLRALIQSLPRMEEPLSEKEAYLIADQRLATLKCHLVARCRVDDVPSELKDKAKLFLVLSNALAHPLVTLGLIPKEGGLPYSLNLHTRKILLLETLQHLDSRKEGKPASEWTLEDVLAPLQRDTEILKANSWEEIPESQAKAEVNEMLASWSGK